MTESFDSGLHLDLSPTRAAPRLARLFVAETARAAEVPEELVADLRLAVSEAVTAVLDAGLDPIPVQITLTATRFTVQLPPLPPTTEGVGPRTVLEGLDTLRVTEEAEQLTIEATVPPA